MCPNQGQTTIFQQRLNAVTADAEEASWCHRDSSKVYYPHVKQYPTGWKRVPPVPPPAK